MYKIGIVAIMVLIIYLINSVMPVPFTQLTGTDIQEPEYICLTYDIRNAVL